MCVFLHSMLCIASERTRCSFSIFLKSKIDSPLIQEIPTTISSLSAPLALPPPPLSPDPLPLYFLSDESSSLIDDSHIGQNKGILRQGKSSHVEDKQGNQLGGKSLKEAKESEIHPVPHVTYFKCFYYLVFSKS